MCEFCSVREVKTNHSIKLGQYISESSTWIKVLLGGGLQPL